ncbi:MAG: NAD(P)-dependent oxidoreductase, partial [Deltaproteobacteria bacterium CG11_big_fil_rev_8_21_14_0_20_45_16]
FPKNIVPLGLDLRKELSRLSECVDLKSIGVLINNAGLARGTAAIDKTSKEDWLEMYETNVLSLIEITQMLLPSMIERKAGDIVNIGSVAGYQTYPGGSIYASTKFCVRALTESWRKDLLGKGIRVIGIHPGMVETEFSKVRFRGDEEKAAAVYKGMRPLTAQDVARSMAWSLELPRHINIESMLLMPTDQAAAGMVARS